jgi:hypothetical protein
MDPEGYVKNTTISLCEQYNHQNTFLSMTDLVPRVHEAVDDLLALLVVIKLALHAEPRVQLRGLVTPPLLQACMGMLGGCMGMGFRV